MKSRKYDHDHFNKWADFYAAPYYWLQIDYDMEDFRPFHITAETNSVRDGHISWPVKDTGISSILPVDHLDFRAGTRDLSDWHRKLTTSFGKGRILPPISSNKAFSSYEEYIRSAKFTRNSCIDIDCIKRSGGAYIGIEATHLKVEMGTKDKAHNLFGQILKRRFFRSDAHQLLVQYKFMRLLGGKLFLLAYNIKRQRLDQDGQSILLPVDNLTVGHLQRRNLKACIDATLYGPFLENYNRCFQAS